LEWLRSFLSLVISYVYSFGAIVPYVLRRVPEKGLKLVGETFVYGIMDGESMDIGLYGKEFCLL
jgi:hypothetical protein